MEADGGMRVQHKRLFCGMAGEVRLMLARQKPPGRVKHHFR